ncbi:hypothetical protein [Pseudorhodoplanes sp.]|uniref:hypothetical protein n=1 Tax=Pseudorhodoplanes sp. TaxID=1934341 RepID=UPI003D112931
MSYLALARRLRAEVLDAPEPPPAHCMAPTTRAPGADPIETGTIAAVLLRGSVIGDAWLVADDDALAEHSDLAQSGLPVFRFAEVPFLAQLDAEALRAVAACKRAFPTARVLQ